MAKNAAGVPRYYLDSCVFLSLINEEARRYKIVETILDDAENQQCEVYTSQLSIAEVAFGDQEKKGKALSKATAAKIEKLWHPNSPIRLVDLHSIIAIDAKEVIRDAMKHGWTKGEDWSIKPPDAVHLATAQSVKAQDFMTYDARLLKLKHISLKIREPFFDSGPHRR